MKGRITRQAQRDLDAIGDEIDKDNPSRAISFVGELVDVCLALSKFPRRFPVFGKLRGRIVRKRSHGDYAILYCVFSDRVEIVHVLHGARDIWSLLDGGA